jgi:peptide/nickel transport system substrate-binding protein
MKIYKALIAVAASAALAMGTVTATSAATSTLKLGSIGNPVSLAADQGAYGNSVWFYQAVYDTILRKTPEGKLVPGVATKWAYNGNKTVLTLTIREGIKFTDNAKLDAAAVAKNILANRDGGGVAASYLKTVKSAVAKNATTVVVTLTGIDPSILEYLADSAGLIASPKSIGTKASATTPVGSGPYVIDKAKTRAGSTYVYKANPNYWDKASRKYDNLVINIYAEKTAMANALKSGAVSGGTVLPEFLTSLKEKGFKMASSYEGAQGIYFSDRNGARKSCVQDVNVRRAINSVLDRAALLKTMSAGAGRVTTQYFPDSNPGFNKALDSKYPYSVDAAKAFMAKSAYATGCTISMMTYTPFFGEAVYSVIKSQFALIGITVKETEEDIATLLGNIQAPKYDAYLMVFERSANPWTLMNFMVSKNANWNAEKYTEPKVEALIDEYPTATDARRVAILKAINTEIVNNAWFSPWYASQSNFAYKGIALKAQAGNVLPFLYNIK